MDIVLRTTGLKKYYGAGETQVKALNGVDLEIERETFTAITGASGSGKTTLFNLIGGLDTPTEGSIEINGIRLSELAGDPAAVFRRRQIGFVFQNYNLIPILNVWENILFPLSLDNRCPDRAYISHLVCLLGLEGKLNRLPASLSAANGSGAATPELLAARPSILLADEPTAILDSKSGISVASLLRQASRELHQTIVMITHNLELAHMADRIVQIEDGRITQDEDTAVLSAPFKKGGHSHEIQ